MTPIKAPSLFIDVFLSDSFTPITTYPIANFIHLIDSLGLGIILFY